MKIINYKDVYKPEYLNMFETDFEEFNKIANIVGELMIFYTNFKGARRGYKIYRYLF